MVLWGNIGELKSVACFRGLKFAKNWNWKLFKNDQINRNIEDALIFGVILSFSSVQRYVWKIIWGFIWLWIDIMKVQTFFPKKAH